MVYVICLLHFQLVIIYLFYYLFYYFTIFIRPHLRLSRNPKVKKILSFKSNFCSQMDTISLPPTVTFKMEECKLYFGGVPPDFDTSEFESLKFGHLLGSLRGITISNPGSNSLLSPLYTQRFQPNPFYGVEPNCERKVWLSIYWSWSLLLRNLRNIVLTTVLAKNKFFIILTSI